ncbi:MAG: hypothetical protein ACTSWQ_09165 [Candidatus Thorarchaeota archaeon]
MAKVVIRTSRFLCPCCGEEIMLKMSPMVSDPSHRNKGGSKERGFSKRTEAHLPTILKMLHENWKTKQIVEATGVSKGVVTKIRKKLRRGELHLVASTKTGRIF